MTEEFLQYVWKHALFNRSCLFTSDKKVVQIISAGQHNHNSGPDFFNARLRIDGTLWAGNVEVHVRSSAWGQHKHQYDEAYKNVILHVVWEDDEPVLRANHTKIPAIELKRFVPKGVYDQYSALRFSSKDIPCEKKIASVDTLTMHAWFDRLLTERLEKKTDFINTKLNKNINDWEETFYQLIVRNLGSPVNTEPFERLASAASYKMVARQVPMRTKMEALLFGQAGLLEGTFNDEYPRMLQKEYAYLKHKLPMSSISKSEWKFMRIRPYNFPTIRIAQLAAILFKHGHLFNSVMEASSAKDIMSLFSVPPSAYWQTHYRFDKASAQGIKVMGYSAMKTLIINAVVPILFLYGKHTGNEEMAKNALNMLHTLSTEKNHITDKWESIGIQPIDAYESQALIQLRKEYCDLKRCTQCAIGHKLMNAVTILK